MIAGIDSSALPTLAMALAAKAAGVQIWSGYLQTKPNMGLYSPWTKEAFDCARLCGATPIAYCSGWDDPVACKNLAIAWNVRLCLDVEGGIRGDGPWVQPWLTASGAGLYGNGPVHINRTAAFHILAAYPGFNPNATWSGSRPVSPCAWQYQGTHSEFGVGVDRCWFDDWFSLGDDMTPEESAMLKAVYNQFISATYTTMDARIAHLEAVIKAIPKGPAGPAGPAGTPTPPHHHTTGPVEL